jgi:ATPase subunit of ABC transporter with duplicated ATPase domains
MEISNMPSSIILSNVILATPDGRTLVPHINLSFKAERTGLIGRNGVGKTTLLSLIAGEHPLGSGAVTVSGAVGVLRQSVQKRDGEAIVDLFGARQAFAVLHRAETGEATSDELAGADWTLEARIAAALASVGLEVSLGTDLAELSGGQATRARLAALIVAKPDFLLLDEPTNNLDRDGRTAVIEFLAGWRRGAIIVSHDRELLEGMDAIVELTSLGATHYGGNWSQYRESKQLELATTRRGLADAEKRLADIDRKAQDAAEAKARKDAGGRKKNARGDMPRILSGARKDRSEDTGGENSRLADRRRAQALEDVRIARGRIEILQPFAVRIPPTLLPAGKAVLQVDRVSAGYDPKAPVIKDFSLSMTGPERVAIAGPNGSGKTTILKILSGQLQPWAGSVRMMTSFAMFDQTVSLLDPSISILENFRRINPAAEENACRASLAQFMFRADAAVQTVSSLSGGQLFRAGLACVLGGPVAPSLLIMDEPTNHLDVDSIETVEAGLRAYDGALLVVSHDEAFLDAIGISRKVVLSVMA